MRTHRIFGIIALFAVLVATTAYAADAFVLSDFETHPNKLGGIVAVEGDGAPDWDNPNAVNGWYYSEDVGGFDPANVFEGKQSFRLVNGGTDKPMQEWSTFYMLLGDVTDPQTVPATITPFDASSYRAMRFWVKGHKGGERFNVIFRDAFAPNNYPQARFDPIPQGLRTNWTPVLITLEEVSKFADIQQLVMVGVEFGRDLGNKKGNIIYIDRFEFIR